MGFKSPGVSIETQKQALQKLEAKKLSKNVRKSQLKCKQKFTKIIQR